MRSSWIRTGPKSNDKSLEKKGKTTAKGHVKMEADRSSAPRGHGTKNGWQSPEAGRESWDRCSLQKKGVSRRNQRCHHFDFRLLVSRTMRGHISTTIVVICHGSPRNLTQVSRPTPLIFDCTCGYLFWLCENSEKSCVWFSLCAPRILHSAQTGVGAKRALEWSEWIQVQNNEAAGREKAILLWPLRSAQLMLRILEKKQKNL